MLPPDMRRLKQLEDENSKLRKLVADLSLDKEVLQDVMLATTTPSLVRLQNRMTTSHKLDFFRPLLSSSREASRDWSFSSKICD
jgi:hypothetical protein